MFKNGIATVILSLPSHAVGINSAASVVGSYQPAGDSRRHLFRWSADSGAFDLTPDGYSSAEAAAINNRGDILGFGETVSGKSAVLFAHARSQWRADAEGGRLPHRPQAFGNGPRSRGYLCIGYSARALPNSALEPAPDEARDPALQSNDRQYLPTVNPRDCEQWTP